MQVGLSEVLEEQGRSVTWFCERMGVSRALYYRIVAGERTATPKFRAKAASLLGVPAHLLFLPTIVPDGIKSIPIGNNAAEEAEEVAV